MLRNTSAARLRGQIETENTHTRGDHARAEDAHKPEWNAPSTSGTSDSKETPRVWRQEAVTWGGSGVTPRFHIWQEDRQVLQQKCPFFRGLWGDIPFTPLTLSRICFPADSLLPLTSLQPFRSRLWRQQVQPDWAKTPETVALVLLTVRT